MLIYALKEDTEKNMGMFIPKKEVWDYKEKV